MATAFRLSLSRRAISAVRIVKTTEPPEADRYKVEAYVHDNGLRRAHARDYDARDVQDARDAARQMLGLSITGKIPQVWTVYTATDLI